LYKIGILGCGLIAEPMVRSLCKNFLNVPMSVSRRSQEVSRRLSIEFSNVNAGDNQWVLDNSDAVFLCLLADVSRKELPLLDFRTDQIIISVMADISLSEISELVAPATNPCVTIPLPFMEAGGCPLPVYPESPALEKLFGQENMLITQGNEDAMGPHFAATAILSTLMAELDIVSRWLAGYSGSAVDAEKYVASLVAGYLGAMEKDGQERFLEAMEDLSTEGGLNTQLLNHNRVGGLFDTLREGLEQLGERVNG
jgi:pyrroline-5-carboxylate reductase